MITRRSFLKGILALIATRYTHKEGRVIGQPGAIPMIVPYSVGPWPYDGGRPRWVIVHGTASGISYTAQDTARDFQRAGKFTHYVIGYDGVIVQCGDEAKIAWGNGVISGPAGVAPINGGNRNEPHDAYWDTAGHHDPNGCTISIEHARSTDNLSDLSNAQMMASFNLIAGICSRWGIPGHYGDATGGITGHYSIDPANRAFCPGPYPWQQLFNYLSGQPVGLLSQPLSFNQAPQAPMTGFALAPVGLRGVNDVFLAGSTRVHNTLSNTPGFLGLCEALDEASQFPGIYNAYTGDTNPSNYPADAVMSVLGTINGNASAFAIRGGLILLGFLLLAGLVWNVASPLAEQAVKSYTEFNGS